MKPLPQDIEAENALIWSVIIDNNILEKYFEDFSYEELYDTKNKKVMECIFELLLEWKPADILTISSSLKDKWENIPIADIIEYTEIVPTSANRFAYAKIIQNNYKRRQLILAWRKLEMSAYSQEVNIEDAVEVTFKEVNSVLLNWKENVTSVDENIAKLKQHISTVQNSQNKLIWYSWGKELWYLDELTGWIRKWKTYRIWSPSWVWKSNLVYQVIPALLEQGVKVMFVSLENTIETTYIKVMSAVQWVNSKLLENWTYPVLYSYLEQYKDKFVLTDQLFDLGQIKREILKVKPDVVILDYIWLVSIKWCDERTKYDKYADEVKEFVQKNQYLSWIDLSNLNKDDDEDKIRIYKWFNWSAKLRNNVDFAMHLFYHKPFYEYKKMTMQIWAEDTKIKIRNKNAITFFVTKNRMWNDMEEEIFIIDHNLWNKYFRATEEQKTIWKTL